MHQCNCVKCKKKYQSKEEDDYYCEDCLKIHKQEAEEIDKKLANRPKKQTMSDFQKFKSVAKQGGEGALFANAKDLGLL